MVGMGCIIVYSGEMVSVFFPWAEKAFPILINLLALTGAFICIPVMRILGRKAILEGGCFSISLL